MRCANIREVQRLGKSYQRVCANQRVPGYSVCKSCFVILNVPDKKRPQGVRADGKVRHG